MQSLRSFAKPPPGVVHVHIEQGGAAPGADPPPHAGFPLPRSSASVTPPPQDLCAEHPQGQSSSAGLPEHEWCENNPLAWNPLRPKWGSGGEVLQLRVNPPS